MTHLGFIAVSYGLGVGVPAVLAFGVMRRLASARRRLAAIDPRAASRAAA